MPPFRAEHVGSLLRPQAVLTARTDRAAGRISDTALRAIEDDAVRAAVQLQADAGMPVATDGEFRRDSWQWDFFSRVGGISKVEGAHGGSAFPQQTRSGRALPRRLPDHGQAAPRSTDLRRRLRGSSIGHVGDTQALDSVAQHRLPLWRCADVGSGGLSRCRRVAARSGCRLRRGDRRGASPGMQLPPSRRHDVRRAVRSRDAGGDR